MLFQDPSVHMVWLVAAGTARPSNLFDTIVPTCIFISTHLLLLRHSAILLQGVCVIYSHAVAALANDVARVRARLLMPAKIPVARAPRIPPLLHDDPHFLLEALTATLPPWHDVYANDWSMQMDSSLSEPSAPSSPSNYFDFGGDAYEPAVALPLPPPEAVSSRPAPTTKRRRIRIDANTETASGGWVPQARPPPAPLSPPRAIFHPYTHLITTWLSSTAPRNALRSHTPLSLELARRSSRRTSRTPSSVSSLNLPTFSPPDSPLVDDFDLDHASESDLLVGRVEAAVRELGWCTLADLAPHTRHATVGVFLEVLHLASTGRVAVLGPATLAPPTAIVVC